ncbi:hypothetical protein [Actinoallomurus rhizosphaericola]|uniref:hypothetical protein n=1 Tax=Actinoallomurus rhizosphaericola TaxID=2952536 RepID=UPI002090B085|nr:hypothetical protein [Actinoallomurus rhizosphaericola]MCO5993150.1 hypothetical protein [Actinoallomurus rhizosphaericola]
MEHPERSRRRRRDAGLHQVTVWTRRAVGVGVVLSGLLVAGLAHLLPGQAADRTHADPATPAPSEQPATPPDDSAGPTASTGSASARPHRTHRHHLTPPATAPAAPPSTPTRRPTHVTSGGS